MYMKLHYTAVLLILSLCRVFMSPGGYWLVINTEPLGHQHTYKLEYWTPEWMKLAKPEVGFSSAAPTKVK